MSRDSVLLLLILSCTLTGSSQTAANTPSNISTDKLNQDITEFLRRQLEAHVADIKALDPAPDRVVGALTTGEFSWGAFMRTLASYSVLSGQRQIAGRDIPKMVGQIGLIESRQGGKTFAQLYAGIALLSFGADLKTNAVWQSLTPQEQQAWRSLLDPSRFYDRKTRHVINLPENYFGVAARVVSMDYKLGIINDKAFVDDLIDRAAQQFISGNLYSDDALPAGRFDRYSNEYARYVYMAADLVGRTDVTKALEPTLKEQMRTWWDLLSPDGYGYPWGRSLGAISFMDTMEIVAFLGDHPQFRPVPMSQLATAYYAAWQWLSHDVVPDRHLLNVFGFGRGNYSYINKEREWQQTTAFFGKAAGAQYLFNRSMKAASLPTISSDLQLPNVARFEYFRKGDRTFGVWMVRQPGIQFALPVTSGTKPGISDYLPAPYNLLNFAPPVERILPVVTPFLTLADGSTIVASDGADEIEPSSDGRSLHAVWRRWAQLGSRTGQLVDPGIVADVRWEVKGTTLVRTETLSASKPIEVRRMWMIVPSTSGEAVSVSTGEPAIKFESPSGALTVSLQSSNGVINPVVHATGDSAAGKGSLGPVPFLLEFDQKNFTLAPQANLTWILTTAVTPRSEAREKAQGAGK
jgi:hypothetical protein